MAYHPDRTQLNRYVKRHENIYWKTISVLLIYEIYAKILYECAPTELPKPARHTHPISIYNIFLNNFYFCVSRLRYYLSSAIYELKLEFRNTEKSSVVPSVVPSVFMVSPFLFYVYIFIFGHQKKKRKKKKLSYETVVGVFTCKSRKKLKFVSNCVIEWLSPCRE